jgi:hypothetical protein
MFNATPASSIPKEDVTRPRSLAVALLLFFGIFYQTKKDAKAGKGTARLREIRIIRHPD